MILPVHEAARDSKQVVSSHVSVAQLVSPAQKW